MADGGPPASDRSSSDPCETVSHRLRIDGVEFVFSGDNVICLCPSCQAPLTVRLWLGVADCWRCDGSLQINEAAWAAVHEELRERRPARQSPAPITPVPLPRRIPERELEQSRLRAVGDSQRENRLRELEQLTRGESLPRVLANFLQSLPAWLISFLFHLFLILILALLVLTPPTTPESISLVLSTYLSPDREAGGVIAEVESEQPLADDLLPESDGQEAETATERALAVAQADARELTEDPQPLADLPDLTNVRERLQQGGSGPATFAARDPRLRQEIVEREGGTTMTEAAVARGLRWLASVQNRDGSWSLANYARHAQVGNRGDAAATSLALLPFLGAGQTHEFGVYKQTVSRGLAWLMTHQTSDGDLRANYPGDAGMYAHGQATICLCEAYALTGDERFRDAAERAITFIQRAQHREGGWRYQPGQSGDTSVFGWQLMALQSARVTPSGAAIESDTWQLADYYLDRASRGTGRRVPEGALYRYRPDEGPATPSMTAEGLLCRMYLGWKRDDPRLMYGVQWLLKNHLPNRAEPNLYYWYYGTQLMHHYGGREWETWNRALRDMLVSLQETGGEAPGSWSPRGFTWGPKGERIYTTALAICTLEVYYRHLPLFRPLDLN